MATTWALVSAQPSGSTYMLLPCPRALRSTIVAGAAAAYAASPSVPRFFSSLTAGFQGPSANPACSARATCSEVTPGLALSGSENNVKALQVVELKEAIGDVLGRFELTGLAADDIDGALDLVEEVEADADDDAFWKSYLDRVLAAVELRDDGTGPLRTDLPGLENLRLEPWELKAARRAVASSGVPRSERDRTS